MRNDGRQYSLVLSIKRTTSIDTSYAIIFPKCQPSTINLSLTSFLKINKTQMTKQRYYHRLHRLIGMLNYMIQAKDLEAMRRACYRLNSFMLKHSMSAAMSE